MASSNALDVTTQTANLSFKQASHNNRVFNVSNKNGPLGSTPTVLTDFCNMPPNGKKTDDIRGISTFKGRLGESFSTIKLTLTDDTAGDVIDVCRHAMAAWKKEYNPIHKSAWYQKTFGLSDGTKVHLATGGIENTELFNNYVFEGNESYNAPASTFFKAMYGDAQDAPWYYSFGVPTAKEGAWNYDAVSEAVLVLRDENGKPVKAKLGDGGVTMPPTGIPLTDTETIKTVLQSKWYKESRWQCRVAVQLRSIEWKLERDVVTQERVLYPVFHMKTTGSMIFKKSLYVLPEGVVPVEQRSAVLNAALFAGMDEPSKKRKRTNTPKSKPKVTMPVVFAQEVMPPSESDIEGSEDEST